MQGNKEIAKPITPSTNMHTLGNLNEGVLAFPDKIQISFALNFCLMISALNSLPV